MNKTPVNSSLTIESKRPWSTEFQGEITAIKVNGQKINDVHDLAEKVIGMTKTIKVLAYTATSLALMAVLAIACLGGWLVSNESAIQRLLLTSSKDFDSHMNQAEKWRSHKRQRAYIHLEEFHGLHWDEGMQDWVNHSMAEYNKRSKRVFSDSFPKED